MVISDDMETWNVPGTGRIEKESFDKIIRDSKKKNTTVAQTLLIMGWTPDMYDCYINHYTSYSWEDLEEKTGTVQYWADLGWNSTTWGGRGPDRSLPPTANMAWNELSEQEKQAAINLCYFEELWDMTPLDQWAPANEYYNMTNATFVPTMGDTFETTASEEQISALSLTTNPTFNPTTAPVDTYAATPTAPVALPTATSPAPIATTYVSNPNNRFLLWDWLYDVSKEAAITLGYDKTTWNQPMSATVETMTWNDLTPEQQQATYVLGFAPKEIWNCYINHFTGFAWQDLGDAEIPYEALGWTFDKWNALDSPPISENFDWSELSNDERDAAEMLCWTQITWERLNLNDSRSSTYRSGTFS